MKDRDTQYRVAQKILMACSFDSWIPGLHNGLDPSVNFSDTINHCIQNANNAGLYLERLEPSYFGVVEESFFLTPGQTAKIRGDIFEMVSRAILWNVSAYISGGFVGNLPPEIQNRIVQKQNHVKIAAITLGDNYDIRRLFKPHAVHKFDQYFERLLAAGTSMSYSTPDIVVVRLNDPDLIFNFSHPILNLSIHNQDILSDARRMVEGRLNPEDIILAAGLKTSIRSDRMYQLLFEANSWKAIWRLIYGISPPKYYGLMTQSYGADSQKLKSIEFLGGTNGDIPPMAIDGFSTVTNPLELMRWYLSVI